METSVDVIYPAIKGAHHGKTEKTATTFFSEVTTSKPKPPTRYNQYNTSASKISS